MKIFCLLALVLALPLKSVLLPLIQILDVSDFMSEYFTTSFTYFSLFIFSVKAHFPLKSLSKNDFDNRDVSFLFAKAKKKSRPFPPHTRFPSFWTDFSLDSEKHRFPKKRREGIRAWKH
jgi:hypothetical protein